MEWYGPQLEQTNVSQKIEEWEMQKMRDMEQVSAGLSDAEPSTLDTWTAAYSLYNPITSYIVNEPLPDVPYVEGYNPVDDMEGYERYWPAFRDSNNPETTAVIKQRIDREMRNREILQQSDTLTSIASTVAAGFGDPYNLALMMVPGSAFIQGGKVLQSAARSAALGGAATVGSEATLYGTQETREIGESITNLVATAAVDSIIGAGASRWLGAEEHLKLVNAVEEHLTSAPTAALSAGAAEVTGTATGAPVKKATLFFEATGLGHLGRQAMKITPLGRLVLNENQEVRRVVQEMAELSVQIEGDYVPRAVESLIKRDLRLTDIDVGFGRALQKESGMSPEDFSSAVTSAQRRGDTSSNPQAQKLAEYLRPKMNDQWRKAAEARIPGSFREVAEYVDDAGVLQRIPLENLNTPAGRKILEKSEIKVEPIESHTAESFLRRVYDINKVRENPQAFRESWKQGLIDRQQRNNQIAQQKLDDYLSGGDVSKRRVNELKKDIVDIDDDFIAKLDEAVIDIDEKVRNLRPGDMHYTEVAPGSGMFKGRVDIMDEFVEDFLVDDWERLYTGYMKNTSSRINMAERFGQGDGDFMMTESLTKLRENANAKRVQLEEAGDVKAAARVTKNAEKAERDLKYIRDSLLGLLHTKAYGDERNIFLHSMLRTARSWNVATKLNSVLTASIPDMARTVTYNGGRDFAPALKKALKSLPLDSMSENEMMELARAADRVTTIRLQQYSEVDDALPLTKAENWAKFISDKAMTVSGIKHWNALQKGVVGGMVNNRIVKAIKDGADEQWLKSVGFSDDVAGTVRKQINKHATFEDGMWNMNIDRWDSVDAIDAVETAVIKEADKVVLTPSAGDRPIFMSTEAGATIFQFKSFIAASMNKLVMPLMQEQGARKWAEINSLIAMGAFTYYLREKLAGREPSSEPAVILREGIDRSGLSSYILEAYNMGNKLAGHPFGDVPARYRSRDKLGAALGPSAGTASELFKAVDINATPDSRVHAIRKLMPLQNHFLLARPLTVLEGEVAKAAGGTGRYAEPKNIGTAVDSPPTL